MTTQAPTQATYESLRDVRDALSVLERAMLGYPHPGLFNHHLTQAREHALAAQDSLLGHPIPTTTNTDQPTTQTYSILYDGLNKVRAQLSVLLRKLTHDPPNHFTANTTIITELICIKDTAKNAQLMAAYTPR